LAAWVAVSLESLAATRRAMVEAAGAVPIAVGREAVPIPLTV
jgi:hypothetical protein